MSHEPASLLELLEDRFSDVPEEQRLEHVGQLAAQNWSLGPEQMRVVGFLLPAALHAELTPAAAAVVEEQQGGAAFLEQLREGFRFDDFMVAFLQTLLEVEEGKTPLAPPGRQGPSSRLEPKQRLGQYEIRAALGEGGMGRVYRAYQPALDREVAIKVLHPHHAEDEDFLKRFQKEAQATAQLKHPHIVELFEAKSDPQQNLHYLVFEYVAGRSLGDLLFDEGQLPEREALRIGLAVARALECAEAAGYVHRDVKPSNILIRDDRTVKLSDLGLARRVEEDTRMTTAGLVLGTPHYMAPEQAMDKHIDTRADLYSLGVTLFQLITGCLPFDGRTAVAVISQHVNQDLPDARGFTPEIEVSPETSTLIHWLADRKPERRYPTAAEAAASIERVLEGGPPLRPSTLPADAPDRSPPPTTGSFKRSSYYTDSGQLLTGPSGDEATEEEEDEVGRLSLDQEWATVARTRLLASTDPPEPTDPVPTEAEVDQLLLSDDTQRAYRILRRLGQGSQGVVYEVEVLGERRFRGFLRPVERAVMKRATEHQAIRQERLIYSQVDYRLVKLLDHGASRSGRPYLVLERLRATPQDRYRAPNRRRVPTDPATAVELFVNLLDRVKGLHFRRKLPVILCDIKPANVMLRMPTETGALSDEDYLGRLTSGHYEPVFVDLGCAQHRDVLRQAEGRLRRMVGSPIFLPPESIPRAAKNGLLDPGVYGPPTDVYGLTLTFYEWISGRRAYQHIESSWTQAEDPLLALFELKSDHVDPIDATTLKGRLGVNTAAVLEVLRAGLHPDPKRRATTNKLFELARKTFKIQPWRREPRPYAFDDLRNHLGFRQGLFPRLHPGRNHYRRAIRVEPE